jgi:hypothetical protein
MSQPSVNRFYAIKPANHGFSVLGDGQPVRKP